ncbi:MAG: hypothetical protein A2V65_05415 [Deltaproteobacteria bacterium RBG_13_49_15]|nr:MAG: hypothetical protein A2V65_05415 [Deltaproteobacteria bacterium RBG_13_49_15]
MGIKTSIWIGARLALHAKRHGECKHVAKRQLGQGFLTSAVVDIAVSSPDGDIFKIVKNGQILSFIRFAHKNIPYPAHDQEG